jgi:hypothetical protein
MTRVRPFARFWLPVAIAVVGVGGLISASLFSNANIPPGRFELKPSLSSNVLDVGTLLNDRPISITLSVHNSGDGPLALHKITPSCQCILSSAGGIEIAPKDQYKVVVRFDPTEMWGAFTHLITFETSDPRRPTVPVAMSGRLVEPLVPTPRYLDCGEILRSQCQFVLGRVAIEVSPGITLVSVGVSDAELFRVEKEKKSNSNFVVSLSGMNNVRPGSYSGEIIVGYRVDRSDLVTGDVPPGPARYSIGYQVRVTDGAAIAPRELSLGLIRPVPDSLCFSRVYRVHVRTDKPPPASVEAGANSLLAVRRTVRTKHGFDLTLGLNPQAFKDKPHGAFTDRIRFVCKPSEQELQVDVLGFVVRSAPTGDQ